MENRFESTYADSKLAMVLFAKVREVGVDEGCLSLLPVAARVAA